MPIRDIGLRSGAFALAPEQDNEPWPDQFAQRECDASLLEADQISDGEFISHQTLRAFCHEHFLHRPAIDVFVRRDAIAAQQLDRFRARPFVLASDTGDRSHQDRIIGFGNRLASDYLPKPLIGRRLEQTAEALPACGKFGERSCGIARDEQGRRIEPPDRKAIEIATARPASKTVQKGAALEGDVEHETAVRQLFEAIGLLGGAGTDREQRNRGKPLEL